MEKGQNDNHPKKGSIIQVEPIRKVKTIKDLKTLLANKPLDLALFTIGINCALRASDLLSLRVGQVRKLKPKDSLTIRERKTKKVKTVTFNKTMVDAVQNLLESNKDLDDNDYLFIGQRGNVLSVPALNLKIKRWMKRLNVKGNYGCHSLRKTWCFHHYTRNNVPLPTLMKALNHSSQAITLRYIGIEEKDIEDLAAFEL